MNGGTAIRTVALEKRFRDFVAVAGVTFDVATGENFGLLGPNGAGKSTLIRILTTLLEPTAGAATVAGHDVRREPQAVRRAIGVIPQALTSDPDLTAAENLDFYGRLYSLPAATRADLTDELLDAVELGRWRNDLVGTFSGGMRRRLEIARGLMHRPAILFLDEPTTGLDPASRLAMWQMIRRIKDAADLTIFLTTHYIEEADELCDRVAIFDHGHIVALDRPSALKRSLARTEIIDVEFAATPLDWPATLDALPGVVEVRRVNGSYRIQSRDRLATVTALIDATRAHGVDLGSLVARGGTLEDVVIGYTGRDTRDAADRARRLEVRHLYERGRGRA